MLSVQKWKGVVQKQEAFSVILDTDEAVETFLRAAKVKNPAVYRELQQLDLYVKEFKLHEYCDRNFTRGFEKSSQANPRNEENVSSIVAFFSSLARLFHSQWSLGCLLLFFL